MNPPHRRRISTFTRSPWPRCGCQAQFPAQSELYQVARPLSGDRNVYITRTITPSRHHFRLLNLRFCLQPMHMFRAMASQWTR